MSREDLLFAISLCQYNSNIIQAIKAGHCNVQIHRSSEEVLHHLSVFPGTAAGRGNRTANLYRLRQPARDLRRFRKCAETRQPAGQYDQLLPLQALDRTARLKKDSFK